MSREITPDFEPFDLDSVDPLVRIYSNLLMRRFSASVEQGKVTYANASRPRMITLSPVALPVMDAHSNAIRKLQNLGNIQPHSSWGKMHRNENLDFNGEDCPVCDQEILQIGNDNFRIVPKLPTFSDIMDESPYEYIDELIQEAAELYSEMSGRCIDAREYDSIKTKLHANKNYPKYPYFQNVLCLVAKDSHAWCEHTHQDFTNYYRNCFYKLADSPSFMIGAGVIFEEEFTDTLDTKWWRLDISDEEFEKTFPHFDSVEENWMQTSYIQIMVSVLDRVLHGTHSLVCINNGPFEGVWLSSHTASDISLTSDIACALLGISSLSDDGYYSTLSLIKGDSGRWVDAHTHIHLSNNLLYAIPAIYSVVHAGILHNFRKNYEALEILYEKLHHTRRDEHAAEIESLKNTRNMAVAHNNIKRILDSFMVHELAGNSIGVRMDTILEELNKK